VCGSGQGWNRRERVAFGLHVLMVVVVGYVYDMGASG